MDHHHSPPVFPGYHPPISNVAPNPAIMPPPPSTQAHQAQMHPLAAYQQQQHYGLRTLLNNTSAPGYPLSLATPIQSGSTQTSPDTVSSISPKVETPSIGVQDLPPSSQSASPASPPTASTSAAGSSKASKQPFIPPPPPPPLSDPVALLRRSREGISQLMHQGNIDARPSRQAPPSAPRSGACSNCRVGKSKCNQEEPRCGRCAQLGLECSYPLFNKRGRKRIMTPNQHMLENCHRDIEAALAILAERQPGPSALFGTSPSVTPTDVKPSISGLLSPPLQALKSLSSSSSAAASNEGTDDDDPTSRELKSVIESPLAVLAHISSLKVSESTEEESGKRFLPKRSGENESGAAAEGYFATGLYQLRSDADPAYDPVNVGILSARDFERVVEFYFTSLRPFVFHLSPSLHTPRFIRDTSPFLATSLAYIVSSFIPDLHHVVTPLHDHALELSKRVWAEGLKSLEIVQAYLLLIHWTAIENDWGDDRRWGWLGQALRIATEIKLHKKINTITYDFYRSVTPLGEGAFAALSDTRAWSWKLLFVAEIALCVSTGRLGSVSGLSVSTPGAPLPKDMRPEDPDYNVAALVSLNRIYAKAITHSNSLQDSEEGHDSRLRPEFQKAWQRDLTEWMGRWRHINPFVRLIAQHNTTILTSISLRFKGPVTPVLEECRQSAFETVKMALNWPDQSLVYASNLMVVNIAYAATLLLRLAAAKPGPIDHETKMVCAATADVLLRAGAVRPTVRTLATLHGTRIRTLLQADLPKPSRPSSRSGCGSFFSNPNSPGSSTPANTQTAMTGLTGSNSPFMSVAAAEVPTHALLEAQEQGLLFPSAPSLFNLPPSDSHALWDLFHEPGPVNATAGGSTPSREDATGLGENSGMVDGTNDGASGSGAKPDGWMYKSALDQDWLSSEPGAWAW
ncbi:Zn(2)-C6 fungal-type transcription factor [Rhodotorula toruloides]|uniref:BY PROTMAP: gi/472586628/gb/EMS24147.1/ Zn(2)-C6 fungal-type transcription factor [Rhodosporidium toruloides NP11] gi/647398036/emb/CDR41618.1/ RHTO0S06e03532g1_1 [Rhodosporidium toruloides] n=1 Tax=Rhodotorula toruloides TaxID=5286 RepID=A0A0K3CBU4_RHOTO|nr:Zn(2)-C6 fungal-type transcription factor [Rhodotorula toruloides]PRQ76099.1 hypothetical protein AAT19DRAFT_13121 [Rhodotorula toruloides]